MNKMRATLFLLVLITGMPGCASRLPDVRPTDRDGKSLLEWSAKHQGTDWRSFSEVTVGYEGRWSLFPKLTQPVLVDAGYRGSSVERYLPALGRVEQSHDGPSGEKKVTRVRASKQIQVSYNGLRNRDAEVESAAALVADAYTLFLFGASWVLEHGNDFQYAGEKALNGSECHLVEVRLRPGLGRAPEDRVVVWIDRESGIMRRVQFTLNGLESTRGAEVDVTLSGHIPGPDGTLWPMHFVEMIRKPVNTQAHEWTTTSLKVGGVKVK